MAVAGGGATALIMALNSTKTVKSTKALLDNTKEMNKAFESGAMDSLNAVFQGMQATAPVQSAFQVFFANLQAETTESTINLMNTMFEWMASPEGILFLQAFSSTINLMVNSTADIITFNNKLGSAQNNIKKINEGLDEFGLSLGGFKDNLDALDEKLKRLFGGAKDIINPPTAPLVDRYESGGEQQIY